MAGVTEELHGPIRRAELRGLLARNRPVVLRGIAAGWPAVGRWTPRRLARALGEPRVTLHRFTRRRALDARLDELAGWMDDESSDHADLYLAWETDLLRRGDLAGDLELRALFPYRLGVVHGALWMGPRGAHTPLHYDTGARNLHAVVYGRKRFLFFPPGDSRHLAPADVYEWSTVFSRIDVRDAGHPGLVHARASEAILEPGDAVYIPRFWWHAAWCDAPTISVNGWWLGPGTLASPRRAADLLRAALHRAGLYAQGRCTCCGHGDLGRHLGWTA